MAIRPYHAADAGAVVRLALRAWEPVFASIRDTLDPAVYDVFYPDGWRAHQRAGFGLWPVARYFKRL